jgi:hypothetical protein
LARGPPSGPAAAAPTRPQSIGPIAKRVRALGPGEAQNPPPGECSGSAPHRRPSAVRRTFARTLHALAARGTADDLPGWASFFDASTAAFFASRAPPCATTPPTATTAVATTPEPVTAPAPLPTAAPPADDAIAPRAPLPPPLAPLPTAATTSPSPPTPLLAVEAEPRQPGPTAALDAVRALLPAATSQRDVARAIGASLRRAQRTPFVKVRRDAAGRTIYEPATRRLHAGPPPGHVAAPVPQQAPDVVIRTIEETAARANISVDLVAQIVLGALTREKRLFPIDPQRDRGLCPVPSLLKADHVAKIIADAGFNFPSYNDVLCGMDLCDASGRLHTFSPNDSSIRLHQAELLAGLQKQVDAGQVIDVTELLRAFPLLARRVISLSCVPKTNGSQRLVHNPTIDDGPNVTTDTSGLFPARLASARETAARLWHLRQSVGEVPKILLEPLDVEACYTQHTIRPQDVLTHVFEIGNRLFASLRALFGDKASGYHACNLSSAIALAVERHCAGWSVDAVVAAYVDDLLLAATEGPAFDLARATLVAELEAVGYPLAVKKAIPAATRNPWIGFIWDTDAMSITLTEKRALKTTAALDDLAARRRIPLRDLQHVTGLVASAVVAVPTLSAFMGNIHACLSAGPQARRAHHFVSISALARQEAALCSAIVAASRGASLMPPDARQSCAPCVFTDASEEGGAVGGYGGYAPHSLTYFSGDWPYAELAARGAKVPHINVLECISSYLAVAAALLDPDDPAAPSYRGISIATDNTASLGAVRRLASSSAAMSGIVRSFATLAARHDCVPFPFHVQGAIHFWPDDLSRGIIPPVFKQRGWRRVTFSAAFLADLITSSAPWSISPVVVYGPRQ